MTTRYRITLEELLPNSQKRAVSHEFAINDKFVEGHLTVMARDVMPSLANELVSTKGFIEEDRFTPQWNAIADQLKEIAQVHGSAQVMIVAMPDVERLVSDLTMNAGGQDGVEAALAVREFFYGDRTPDAPEAETHG